MHHLYEAMSTKQDSKKKKKKKNYITKVNNTYTLP